MSVRQLNVTLSDLTSGKIHHVESVCLVTTKDEYEKMCDATNMWVWQVDHENESVDEVMEHIDDSIGDVLCGIIDEMLGEEET
jgi:hypothetical protein